MPQAAIPFAVPKTAPAISPRSICARASRFAVSNFLSVAPVSSGRFCANGSRSADFKRVLCLISFSMCGFVVCRFLQVCVSGNSTILLPSKMQFSRVAISAMISGDAAQGLLAKRFGGVKAMSFSRPVPAAFPRFFLFGVFLNKFKLCLKNIYLF